MLKNLDNKTFKLKNNLIYRYEPALEEEGGGLFIYSHEKKSMFVGNKWTFEILKRLGSPKDLVSLAKEIAADLQLSFDDVLPPLRKMMAILLEEHLAEISE